MFLREHSIWVKLEQKSAKIAEEGVCHNIDETLVLQTIYSTFIQNQTNFINVICSIWKERLILKVQEPEQQKELRNIEKNNIVKKLIFCIDLERIGFQGCEPALS